MLPKMRFHAFWGQSFTENGLYLIYHTITCSSGRWVGGGGRSIPYNGQYGEAPSERGTFFTFQVYKRVGISQVEVYKRVGKSVI